MSALPVEDSASSPMITCYINIEFVLSLHKARKPRRHWLASSVVCVWNGAKVIVVGPSNKVCHTRQRPQSADRWPDTPHYIYPRIKGRIHEKIYF